MTATAQGYRLPRPPVRAEHELCRDCQACTLGCSLSHDGECSLGLARLRVTKDMASYRFAIAFCQHCEDPECLASCPTGAIHLDQRGVAILVDDECIRCGACATACPHDALFYDRAGDRYLKCDLCAGRDAGPLCVELCPVGALVLIDRQDSFRSVGLGPAGGAG